MLSDATRLRRANLSTQMNSWRHLFWKPISSALRKKRHVSIHPRAFTIFFYSSRQSPLIHMNVFDFHSEWIYQLLQSFQRNYFSLIYLSFVHGAWQWEWQWERVKKRVTMNATTSVTVRVAMGVVMRDYENESEYERVWRIVWERMWQWEWQWVWQWASQWAWHWK